MRFKRILLALIFFPFAVSAFSSDCGLMPCAGAKLSKIEKLGFKSNVKQHHIDYFKQKYPPEEAKLRIEEFHYFIKIQVDRLEVTIILEHDRKKVCSQSVYIRGIKKWNQEKLKESIYKITKTHLLLPKKEPIVDVFFRRKPTKSLKSNVVKYAVYNPKAKRISIQFVGDKSCPDLPIDPL